MKVFFALLLLGLFGMAMAAGKDDVIVGAAPIVSPQVVVTDVTKEINVQQAAPLRAQQAQVFTTTIPTTVPALVPARTPVAFIGFADAESSAAGLVPFKFW